MVGNYLSAWGGSRGVCEDLSERLADRGWMVITTSARPGRLARFVDMTRVAWSRRAEYQVAQVDVYSGASFVWAEWVSGWLKLMGKKVILTLHGGNLPVFAKRWPGRVGRLLRQADRVTAPSEYLRTALRPWRPDIDLVPNPIDLKRYSFRLRDRPKPNLVWLRALHRIYNPVLAVEVVAALRRSFPNIRLALYGLDKRDGVLGDLDERIRGFGLADTVRWNGGVPKTAVPNVLSESDVFLNTTDVDNTPVSVIEAMACGLCVVSTDVGGVPDLVRDGEDGLLVGPRDPVGMAAAVTQILEDSGLSARLSGNARRRVAGYDWGSVLPEWEKLVTDVEREAVQFR